MDNALETPLLSAQNTTENAPLCSVYAQVDKPKYNPLQVKELCKEEVVEWLKDNGYSRLSDRVLSCGTSFLHLDTPKSEHKFARLRCKNEFCPSCGAQNSNLHLRRVSRASLRLLWNGLLGYFVFTLPKEVSAKHPSKETIENLINEAWKIVKKNFETPGGLSRIHFIGEEPGNLHLHINFLFPLLNAENRGMISKEKLNIVRNAWKNVLNTLFELDLKDANFHYSFASQIGKKIHKIRYVLRPIVTAMKFLTLSDEDRQYILTFTGCQGKSCYDKKSCSKEKPCWVKRFHGTKWHGDLSNGKYKEYLKARGVDVDKMEAEIEGCLSPLGERYRVVKLKNGKRDIVREEDLPLRNLRWLDHDTLIDRGSFAHLNAQEPGG